MMKVTDLKLKKALARGLKSRPRGSCLADGEIAGYVEGALSEDQQERVQEHLSRCPECLEIVMVTQMASEDVEAHQKIKVPASAIAWARKLDPARKGVMEVVISFAKGAAEVVKMSAGVSGECAPAADAVRGEGKVVSETLVTFNKQFPPYQAEVDVEKSKKDRGEITVKLMDETSGQPPRGVRVSLFDDDNELESAMLESGLAVFEDLKFGKYRVEITRVGAPIGGITLEMKGDGS